MATPQEIAAAWAQAYAPPAASTYSAPATTNYGNLSAGIGQDVLARMQGTRMWDPSGGDGSTGQWGWEGDPNNPNDPQRLVYHAQGQGPGEQYATFDPTTGAFKGYETGSGIQSYASGVLSVLAAAAGGAALGGLGGAAGEAGAGAGAGAVDLGGGLTMGADGSIIGAGSSLGAFPTNAAIMEGVGAGGGTAAMGAGAGGVIDLGGGLTMSADGTVSGAGSLGSSFPSNAGIMSSIGAGGAGGLSITDAIKAAASKFMGNGGSTTGNGFNWGSLLGPAASLAGGYLNSSASKDAANTLAQGASDAAALSAPWRQAGTVALNRMQELLGIGGNSGSDGYGSLSQPFTFTNDDPSYQWRLDQGLKGVNNTYAAKGDFLSGGALKGINDYAQGAASTEYQAAYNRDQATKTSDYNRLASLAGAGQTAANTIGEYGTQAANANASGTVGSANAMSNALTGAWGTYQGNQMMNALLQRKAPSGGGNSYGSIDSSAYGLDGSNGAYWN